MRLHFALVGVVVAAVMPAIAAIPFDCDRGIPLQEAVHFAFPGETLALSGTCSGPIVITGKNLTLESKTNAVIDGDSKDAISVNGPARVTLKGLIVQNGLNGIKAAGGAQLVIRDMKIRKNAQNGILLLGASSATISGSSTNENKLNGLDAEASSAVILTGTYVSESNAVFGVNINGSSNLTLIAADVTVAKNILGIQIGTSASAFISDSVTKLTVQENATTGLTIVSGAHMVAFGGTILATGNGVHGVSVDSKAGLDLDAAALLTSRGNGQDGVHLEETSVLTMFNTPAFSGAPGTTTLVADNNLLNGISILTGSNLTVIHFAAVNSTGNTGAGILVDNGSGLTLVGSMIQGNGKDVSLSFGSRGDITGTTVGELTCDATVLLRGDTGKSCK